MGLDHTIKVCKGHPMHITTLTKTHPFPLRAPFSSLLVYIFSIVFCTLVPFLVNQLAISAIYSSTTSVECTTQVVEAPIQ